MSQQTYCKVVLLFCALFVLSLDLCGCANKSFMEAAPIGWNRNSMRYNLITKSVMLL